jgi:predicted RNA-binding Zn ribbon-like protein
MSTSAPRPAPLFVGDHLAMDFINSTATPDGEPVEWLAHGPDLVDWLERAGVIEPDVAKRLRRDGDRAALDRTAAEARELRSWLRAVVLEHEGRALPVLSPEALAPLNRMLARDRSHLVVSHLVVSHLVVEPNHDHQHARRIRDWAEPGQLLQPIAEAIADLVCHVDFRLVRACEGTACTLIFLDRTKAHRRRWCSMAACGNRAKVAAHRARAATSGAIAS